jgi:TolA-binding protein
MTFHRLIHWGFLLLLLATAAGAVEGEARELEYARRLFKDGVYDLAAEQSAQFRERWPSSGRLDEVLLIEGDSRFAIGEYEPARRAYQRLALQHGESPLAATAAVRAADCLVLLGRPAEAAQALRRVAEYHPQAAEAVPALLRAEALWPAEDLDGRRDLLARLLRDYGDRAEAVEARRRLAGNWLARGDAARAERELAGALSLAQPGEALARAAVEWADLLDRQQRSPEALARLAELQPLLATTPWRGLSRRCEGTLRLRLGQYGEAEAALAAWVAQLDPGLDDPLSADSLRVLLGDARARLGRFSGAAEAYAACAEPAPARRWRLAWSLQRAGRPGEAAAVWKPLIADLAARELPLATREARLLAGALERLLAIPSAELGGTILGEEIWNRAAAALAQPPEGYEAPLALVDGLLAAGRLEAAAALLAPEGGPLADDRALRRIRLAAAGAEWGRVGRLREEFLIRYPLSPLRPELERDFARHWRRHVESAALNERLLGLLARQNAGGDPAELALAFGRLYLEDLGRPGLAEPQFRLAATSAVDSVRQEAWWGLALALSAQGDDRAADSLLAVRAGDLSRSPRAWEALRRSLPGGETPLGQLDDGTLAARDAALAPAIDALPPALQEEARRERLEGLKRRLLLAADESQTVLAAQILGLLGGEAGQAWRLEIQALALQHLGRQEEATAIWRRLLAEFPETPAAVEAELALAILPETDDGERLLLLENIRLRRPYHPAAEEARGLVAGLHLRQGRPAAALAIYEELLARAGAAAPPIEALPAPAPELLYQRALCLEALGPPAAAREAWLHFVGAGGETQRTAHGLLRLGEAWLAEGHGDEALRAWRTLQTLLPGTPDARTALARMAAVYSAGERHGDALAALEELQAGRSADPVLRAQWIKALHRGGRLDEGRGELARLLKEERGAFDADTLQASVALAHGRWQHARRQLDEAARTLQAVPKKYPSSPAAPLAQLELARVKIAAGANEQALALLQELPRRWPGGREAARAAVLRGTLHRQAGEVQQAVGEFRRAVDEAPDDETRRFALNNLIVSYRELGFLDGALISLRRYLELWPDAPDRFAKRFESALLVKELGDHDAALEQLRRLLPEADLEDEAAVQYYIGETLQQKGDLAAAILEYMKVPYLGRTKLDWDVTALYQAGQCWEQLAQPERARSLYERIVRERGAASSYGKAAQERVNLLRYLESGGGRP